MCSIMNNSIKRIFRLGDEDRLDAENEGYAEEENDVNDNLEYKESTERFVIFSNIIIQSWDVSESPTL